MQSLSQTELYSTAFRQEEWQGQTSQKFTTNKRHVEPIVPKEVPHPLYSMCSKRHFSPEPTPTYEWKPSIKVVDPVDHSNDR